MSKIAYLGPRGTFTEQAARALTAECDAELVGVETVALALSAVRSEQVVAAVVPIENSVEGSVSDTLDSLVGGDPVVAVAETQLPIRFDVLARTGTSLDEVGTVVSHPHALAQVRFWLDRNLPNVETRPTNSTAAAAPVVAEGGADAAVVAPLVSERWPELDPLASGIADTSDAVTRFLLVRAPGTLPGATGTDRTSIAAVIDDEVGSLSELLSELSLRGINLSRIESRPTKDRLGAYRFFLDFDGHVTDARVGDALTGLRRRCREVRFLGSYPKADRAARPVDPAASERSFRASAQWLSEVRAGRLA